MSQYETQVSRSASETASSEKSRISVIEKSVTHLLVATKTLLETLTKWSKQQATESEVSDVYVRLGYEFNIACRAFKSVGVETNDLGPVPDLLREILEETLSGEPSHAHLDKYLPQIRDIIVNLLQGLKRKQQKLRQRHPRDRDGSSASGGEAPQHSVSLGSGHAITSSDGSVSRQGWRSTDGNRPETINGGSAQEESRIHELPSMNTAPQRSGSGAGASRSTPFITEPTFYPSAPTINEPPPAVAAGPISPSPTVDSASNQQTLRAPDNVDSPQSRGKHGDALAALQRGGELERRASRRFSAYQIQRHLGASSSSIPMIPPPQHSPLPNRGRDGKDSASAARVRTPQTATRVDSSHKYSFDTSPTRQTSRKDRPQTIMAEPPSMASFAFELAADSSPVNTTQDKPGLARVDLRDDQFFNAATDGSNSMAEHAEPTKQPLPAVSTDTLVRHPSRTVRTLSSKRSATESPQSTKELTLFLQYKARVKKFVLADGYEELSIARLQLAFIEKFAWNTHSNGVDLPEIYIQDPISGVRHELEHLADVKDRSVLILNVDAVDEVKKHVDDGLGGLKSLMQDVRSAITDQAAVLQAVADKQKDAAKAMTRIASQPTSPPPPSYTTANGIAGKFANTAQMSEIQSLRKELAVLRQTYTSWTADVQSSMAAIKTKAESVAKVASEQPAATADGVDGASGRHYVTAARKTLNTTSEAIMTRVEDLQDTVEDLRKDVVTRGVRPLPRQLEVVNKELSAATQELKKLQEYMRREKPTWTKIWKNELQVVCEDQALIKYQEELVVDLEADLASAADTFALVEEATKQQNLANASANGTVGPGGGGGAVGISGSRNTSRTLASVGVDPLKAKDGVLDEVKALRPNHETRLEAIERAERMRQRELEERRDDVFKKELTGFVDAGRLKKSGGVEEAERVRNVKDERMRRQVWNRMNGRPDSYDATAEGATAVDVAAASLTEELPPAASSPSSSLPQDLGSLAGSGLPPPSDPAVERADAAIAESASVPQPLDVPTGHHPFHDPGPATPEPDFVEAAEHPRDFFE